MACRSNRIRVPRVPGRHRTLCRARTARADVASGNSEISNPYEILKDLSQGKRLTREDLADFVLKLDISQGSKDRLLALSPKDYTGLAKKLAESI